MPKRKEKTTAFKAVESLVVSLVCVPVSGAIAQVHDVIDRRRRREEEEFEMEEMEMERIAALAEKQRKKREAKLKGLSNRDGGKKRKKKKEGEEEGEGEDSEVDVADLKPRMSIEQRRRLHRRKRRRYNKVEFYQHDEEDSGLELLGYIGGVVMVNVLLLAYLYVFAPLLSTGLDFQAATFANPFVLFVCVVAMLAFIGVSRDNALDIRLDVERGKERIKYGNINFFYLSYDGRTGEPKPKTFPMNNWANILGVGGRMLTYFQMVCLVMGARNIPLPPYLGLQEILRGFLLDFGAGYYETVLGVLLILVSVFAFLVNAIVVFQQTMRDRFPVFRVYFQIVKNPLYIPIVYYVMTALSCGPNAATSTFVTNNLVNAGTCWDGGNMRHMLVAGVSVVFGLCTYVPLVLTMESQRDTPLNPEAGEFEHLELHPRFKFMERIMQFMVIAGISMVEWTGIGLSAAMCLFALVMAIMVIRSNPATVPIVNLWLFFYYLGLLWTGVCGILAVVLTGENAFGVTFIVRDNWWPLLVLLYGWLALLIGGLIQTYRLWNYGNSLYWSLADY